MRTATDSILLIVALLVPLPAAAGVPSRFESSERLSIPADWVSAYDGRVAFGAGRRIALGRDGLVPEVDTTLELDEVVSAAILTADRLYFARGREIGVIEPGSAAPAVRTHPLSPPAEAPLRLARMGDFLLVGEDDAGLRILTLPPKPGHAKAMPGHRHAPALTQVGFLPLEGAVDAVAASVRTVYVALRGEGLAVIDARDPAQPFVSRRVPLTDPIHALATSGPRVYALGPAGLTVLDMRNDETRIEGTYPELTGSAVSASGRALHLASGDHGLDALRDRAPFAMTFNVDVSSNVFTPDPVMISVGDTIHWENVGGFHNVESCDGASGAGGNDPDPPGCPAATPAAEGFFTSGDPGFGWTYDLSFTQAGDNPYFCQVHAGFGMFGTIEVLPPVAPPGVPDGSPGAPLRVAKILPDGSRLSLAFDDTTCVGNADHHVVHGLGSQLPTSLGGTYGLGAASLCDAGGTPAVWNGVPDPSGDPTGFLWFLVLADDDATTEGSWGTDSAGGERSGPVGGTSGKCGVTTKDLTNVCGQ